MERCLACEAVVSKGPGKAYLGVGRRSVSHNVGLSPERAWADDPHVTL